MSQRVKNRSRVSEADKLSYKEWASKFLPLLNEARQTLSLRDISLALGENIGWSDAAREHRSVTGSRHLQAMEILVRRLRAESVGIHAAGHDRDTGEILTPAAVTAALKEPVASVLAQAIKSRMEVKPAPIPTPLPQEATPMGKMTAEPEDQKLVREFIDLADKHYLVADDLKSYGFPISTLAAYRGAARGTQRPILYLRAENAEKMRSFIRDWKHRPVDPALTLLAQSIISRIPPTPLEVTARREDVERYGYGFAKKILRFKQAHPSFPLETCTIQNVRWHAVRDGKGLFVTLRTPHWGRGEKVFSGSVFVKGRFLDPRDETNTRLHLAAYVDEDELAAPVPEAEAPEPEPELAADHSPALSGDRYTIVTVFDVHEGNRDVLQTLLEMNREYGTEVRVYNGGRLQSDRPVSFLRRIWNLLTGER